ncbi:probable cytochrome P450 49a1 isoform X2 [Saccostrea echinata]|uniref:probable cytochrome P450 49a1 isoform X2 n=1 Tax=Saccostrea echinata TaxID=191078 RepID=UPI002A83D098|nr:probable cytochrome P450 49a1 isoform X2 [Saccostrea echinata]
MYHRNMNVIGRRLSGHLQLRLFSSQATVAFFQKSPDVKPFEEIPGATGRYALPYSIGNIFLLKSLGCLDLPVDLTKFMTTLHERYGEIVRIRTMKKNWGVFLFHPDLGKEVLEIQMKHPFRPPVDILKIYNEKENLGQSLANLNGEEWAQFRKPSQELILRPVAVSAYVGILSKVAGDFVEKIKNCGKIDDLRPTLVNYATESLGMLCFNRRLGCLDDRSVIDINLLEDMFDAIDRDFKSFGLKLYRFFNTPLYKKFKSAADQIHSICQKEIKGALTKLEAAKQEGRLEEYLQDPNLLYSLLSHPRMTPDNVDRLILDLFIAGVESTSNTLSFLWFELAKNPDKQDKLHQEIISVCGRDDITKEALAKMPYLKACMRETMRIYVPTTPGTFRCFDKDIVIGGYHVPAGTDIVPCLQHMCHNPRLFKSPDSFLPERFVRDDNTLTEEYKNTNPFVTIPFGVGPRSCIGKRFAETEMHVITAKFFQQLEASLPPGTDPVMEYKYRTFATPKNPVPLLIKPREN